MLEHWLIELIGHVSGLSDEQLEQIDKSLPATKALMDLLNRARPIIEEAQKLHVVYVDRLEPCPAGAEYRIGWQRPQQPENRGKKCIVTQILRQSQKPYPVYELAGPRVYSYEELLRTIARIAGLRPVLIRMPFAFWGALAGVAEVLPRPPLTRNQVELMQIDTTASESLPGFRALRISPRSLEDELKAMLRQSKPRVLTP
jgi:hypothetical protein